MTDSEVIFDCYEGEPLECYADTIRRAQKTWTCEECRHPIVKGERHHHIKYRWEGEFFEHRVCLCCEAKRCAVAEKASEGGDQMCILRGELLQAIRDGLKEGWLTEKDLEVVV